MTNDTFEQERKYSELNRIVKLSRMLLSISGKYPRARLLNRQDGFGVLLEDTRSLLIVTNGNWTSEDLRDLLALFAMWLVAEPGYLKGADSSQDGRLFAEIAH